MKFFQFLVFYGLFFVGILTLPAHAAVSQSSQQNSSDRLEFLKSQLGTFDSISEQLSLIVYIRKTTPILTEIEKSTLQADLLRITNELVEFRSFWNKIGASYLTGSEAELKTELWTSVLEGIDKALNFIPNLAAKVSSSVVQQNPHPPSIEKNKSPHFRAGLFPRINRNRPPLAPGILPPIGKNTFNVQAQAHSSLPTNTGDDDF